MWGLRLLLIDQSMMQVGGNRTAFFWGAALPPPQGEVSRSDGGGLFARRRRGAEQDKVARTKPRSHERSEEVFTRRHEGAKAQKGKRHGVDGGLQ